MDSTFDAGAGLAEQGALSANPNLTTSGVTCQPVAGQGDTLRDIGGQMANVMFNLKQKGGPDAAIYSDLQAKWDAAVRAQLSGNSGELQPSGSTGELVQGEDSARLDAADFATIEEATKVLESAAKHNSLMGRTVFADVQRNRAERLRAIIDRARASAETGGVKP